MTDEETDMSFPQVPYKDSELNKVWRGIQALAGEQGRVFNAHIVENADTLNSTYQTDTLRNDLLPRLRNDLERREIISVEYEDGGGDGRGGGARKVWVIH